MNLLDRFKKIREAEKKKAEEEKKFPADQTMYAIPIGDQTELQPKKKRKSKKTDASIPALPIEETEGQESKESDKKDTKQRKAIEGSKKDKKDKKDKTNPSVPALPVEEELESPPITQTFEMDEKDSFILQSEDDAIQTAELLSLDDSKQSEEPKVAEQREETIIPTDAFIITSPELLGMDDDNNILDPTKPKITALSQEESLEAKEDNSDDNKEIIIESSNSEAPSKKEETLAQEEAKPDILEEKKSESIPKQEIVSQIVTEHKVDIVPNVLKEETKPIQVQENIKSKSEKSKTGSSKEEKKTPSDFAGISPKPKYSIRFKMMMVISLILGVAVSTIIFLASWFFKTDNQRAVETNTFELVRVLELKVRADLNSVVDKGKQLAITLNQSFKDPRQKQFLIDQFFKNDNDFIFLGVYSNDDNQLQEVQTVFNKNYMEKVSMEESDVLSVITRNKNSFMLSFNGASILFNASIGLEEPTICISIPPVEEINDKYVLVIMFKLEKILDAFNKSGISETFMVSGDGVVVAHHNPEYVKSAKNLSDNPIVRRLLSNPEPNYQTSFADETGKKFLGSYQKVKLGFSNLGIISVVPEDKAFEGVYNIQERNIYIMIIALCASLIIVFIFARTISKPVMSLLSETVKIAQGDFKVDLKRTTNDEVGVLTDYFGTMAQGLEEREKVKSILGSMIDPVVVEEAMKDLATLKRGSEKIITSFFSDVAGFSTISEQLTSVQLAALLNEYLSAMTTILQRHGGVLDKYIGDAIVGIFNAPVDVEEHYLKACRASVEMIAKLKELKAYWVENNLYSKEAQEMDVRIGLNIGPAKVGFMGTDSMGSYTMMGDTVNLAARLEAAGKDYGVNILISEMVNEKITHEMFTRELDLVRVKGKNEPVTLYELIGRIEDIPENIKQSTKLYEEAFKQYLERNWEKAIELLEESLKVRGKKDKAVYQLKERCESYLQNPPDASWDGVYTRTHK